MFDNSNRICYLEEVWDLETIMNLFIKERDQILQNNETILKLNFGSRDCGRCNKNIIFHQSGNLRATESLDGILTGEDAWFGPDNTAYSFFVLDLGCFKRISGVYLQNLISEDRGTKTFRMYFYDEEGENITQIETDIDILEQYNVENTGQVFVEFNENIEAKFLVFQIISFYGEGGGLSFFEEYESLNPGTFLKNINLLFFNLYFFSM